MSELSRVLGRVKQTHLEGYRERSAIARELMPGRLVTYVMTLAFGIVFFIPFFWTISSSLKHWSELMVFPPEWLPTTPQWVNYLRVFQRVPYARYIRNTVHVTVGAMVGQLVSSSLVAYGFARFRFRARETLFLIVLSTMILPNEVTLIPLFIIFKNIGWIDTYLPLIVPGYFGGGAFLIFLFRQFLMTIPRDLDESAKIDGAGSFRVFWNILLPLCKPALATAAIFSFMGNWNDFMGPLIYLDSNEKYTLALGLHFFRSVPEAGGIPMENLLMAASVIMIAPCLLVFFMMQRYFVQGVVMSGIKG